MAHSIRNLRLQTEKYSTFSTSAVFCLFSIVMLVIGGCSVKAKHISNVTQQESLDFGGTCAHVCQTKLCHNYGEILNDTMDFLVDPCDDFYQHVCGNWHSKLSYTSVQIENFHKIVQLALEKKRNTGKSKALQYMTVLYQDCIDWSKREELGAKPILILLKQILGNDWSFWGNASFTFDDADNMNEAEKQITVGQFEKNWKQWKSTPKVEHDDHPDVEQWMDCVVEASLIKMPFIIQRITISENDDGGGRVGIVLSKGFDYSEEIEHLHKHFHNLKNKISIILDIQPKIAKPNNSLTVSLFEVIEFKLKLATIYKQPHDQNRPFYERISLAQLSNRSFAHFNWTLFVNKFIKKVSSSSVLVHDSDYTNIFTEHLDLIRPLTELIVTTPIRVLKNVLALNIADSAGLLLHKIQIEETQIDHWSLWQSFIVNNFRSLIPIYTRLFVDYLGREQIQNAREQVRKMVNNMKNIFAESIKQNYYTWLNGETRQETLKKVDAMEAMISHPDWIFDDDALDEEFGFDQHSAAFPIIKGNLIANYFNLIRIMESARFRKMLKNDQHLVKQREFIFASNSIGEYSVAFNQLKISTELLCDASFSVDYPIELNYALVGTIIGHEFLHAFYDRNRFSNKDGLVVRFDSIDWLANSDADKFENRSQCFVRQYDQLVDPNTGNKINGKRTLEENIADNGGVKLAYHALEKHLQNLKTECNSTTQTVLPSFLAQYSHQQLFFLSHGLLYCSAEEYLQYSSHSPFKYRVNIPLSNFDKFAQAFNCPVGSKMNPVDKCELW